MNKDPAHSAVCVYMGSRFGDKPAYKEAVVSLGHLLAQNNIPMVYGGSTVGLMGACADSALEAGGEVRGVIAEDIARIEEPNYLLTELFFTSDMQKRKREMVHLSRAFILCPGGFGSLDEFFEIVVWRQLEFHLRPIFVLNTEGYWNKLKDLMDWIVKSQFAPSRESVQFMDTPEEILQALQQGAFNAI